MTLFRHQYLLFVLLVSLLSVIAWYFSLNTMETPRELKARTFMNLEAQMKNKQQQVLRYLENQKQLALSLNKNKALVSYLQDMDLLYKKYESHREAFDVVERNIQELFVNDLSNFYDLLFVNKQGDIVFTIKKEDDYRKNIHASQFDGLALQKAISSREFAFVDYEYYAVSKEPASFYVLPVYLQQEFIGHFILQLSVNQINNIFVQREGLGKTGEVYLVNENQLMLTDSRFISNSTTLTKQINTKAIELAKRDGDGQAIIRDYRDKWVFSRFSKFNFEGVRWYILAEIDEDEVLTDYYVQHETSLYPEIEKYLSRVQPDLIPFTEDMVAKKAIRVDLGEFRMQKAGNGIYTRGVATCTALAIYYPAKFSYLAHITPTDAIYNDGWLHRKKLAEAHTDILGKIMQRITYEDIRPVELRKIRFIIAAPETKAFRGTLKRLLAYGVLLNQVSIHYTPGQYSMGLEVNTEHTEVSSQWKAGETVVPMQLRSSSVLNMIEILKTQIQYS